MPKRSSKRVGSNQRLATVRTERGHRAPIRLFLLSEHAVNCEHLRLLFAAESDFRVVGSATKWADAARAHACRSDVVVVVLSNPRLPDATALRALSATCAPARVIALTSGPASQIKEALRLDLGGIVANTLTAKLLFKCVKAVASDQYWVEFDIIVGRTHPLDDGTCSAAERLRRNPFGLTGRELQVVSLLLAGHANKAIADKCGIRERTVKQHLTNMFGKVGVSTRLELALFALQKGLGGGDGASPARMLAR